MRIVHTAEVAGKIEVGVNPGDIVMVLPVASLVDARKRRELKIKQAEIQSKLTGKPVKAPSEKNLSIGYGKADTVVPTCKLGNSDIASGGRIMTIQVQAFTPLNVSESLASQPDEEFVA